MVYKYENEMLTFAMLVDPEPEVIDVDPSAIFRYL